MEDRTPYGNTQEIIYRSLKQEEDAKAADVKLLTEQRRHHLRMAASFAERLGIAVCPDCGRSLAK